MHGPHKKKTSKLAYSRYHSLTVGAVAISRLKKNRGVSELQLSCPLPGMPAFFASSFRRCLTHQLLVSVGVCRCIPESCDAEPHSSGVTHDLRPGRGGSLRAPQTFVPTGRGASASGGAALAGWHLAGPAAMGGRGRNWLVVPSA